MKRVLITGITGFVGSHLADFCLQRGLNVFGFRRYHLSNLRNVTHIEGDVDWRDCDMTDQKSVTKNVCDIKPDIVFHMASQSFVSPSWDHPQLYMNANYGMTVNLLEACLQLESWPRIHIPGSGEEYGDVSEDDLPIDGNTVLKPVNPYAVTKIAQDLISYVYYRSYGLEVIRTRAFNHEGPRRDKVFGIPWYAYQVARIELGVQKPVIKVGHIDDKRNFTHVRDMVQAYWMAVGNCIPGELYLIGNDNENSIYTFREALEALIRHSNVSDASYEIDQRYVRPTQVPRLICDPSKFVAATGWRPQIDFETIIEDTLNYWRDELKANPLR